MLWITACSEIASGFWLNNVCCDGLKSGGTVVTTSGRYTYESCDDYVNNGEYVKDACPKTCSGKLYEKNQFVPISSVLRFRSETAINFYNIFKL